MLGRIGLLEHGGGDKVQIENTAKELRKLGVTVDIKTGLDVDVTPYDLVHVFQLDWTAETYFYIEKAKKAGKPVVLSPIHHNLQEVTKFDDEYTFDYRRLQKLIFKNQFHRDTFKNVYRSVLNPKKAKPVIASVFMGLENMHKKSLAAADVVLVQTELEAQDLKKTFGVDITWKKIVNGVGENFIHFKDDHNPLDLKDYIICVGRIEPRKNQLNIIKAVKDFRKEENIEVPLVLIGTKNLVNHLEYSLRFSNELKKNSWIKYIKRVSYEDMPAYYHNAKVGVSASWFETTGLTSLEALFCGTNAVAAGDRAKEYLGECVSYCKPDDVESIKKAIKKEFFAPRPKIDPIMKRDYTWTNAAKETLQVYKEVLKTL